MHFLQNQQQEELLLKRHLLLIFISLFDALLVKNQSNHLHRLVADTGQAVPLVRRAVGNIARADLGGRAAVIVSASLSQAKNERASSSRSCIRRFTTPLGTV